MSSRQRSPLTESFDGGPLSAPPARFAAASALGLLGALILFSLLHAAVSRHIAVNKSDESLPTIDFVRLDRNFELDRRTRERPKPEKPDKPESTPMAATLPQQKLESPQQSVKIPVGKMDVNADLSFGTGLSLSKNDLSSDGDYLPIVKVEPLYPRSAQERGIEGYVILSFTVLPNGRVSNPVVIESEPKGVFDTAAIRAVLRFKYKPRIENGKPVAVTNVQHQITFAIDKSRRRGQ